MNYMSTKKKKFFPTTPSVVKRSTVGILCTIVIGLCLSVIGCVKQKNCEECISGTFLYLKDLKDDTNYQFIKEKKVSAILYVDVDTYRYGMYITGHIPKEYKSGNSIKVRACLEDISENRVEITISCCPVYKLKCIEKED